MMYICIENSKKKNKKWSAMLEDEVHYHSKRDDYSINFSKNELTLNKKQREFIESVDVIEQIMDLAGDVKTNKAKLYTYEKRRK